MENDIHVIYWFTKAKAAGESHPPPPPPPQKNKLIGEEPVFHLERWDVLKQICSKTAGQYKTLACADTDSEVL